MGWAGAIIALIGLITGIYKVFIDPKRKSREKAIEDGKKAVDDRNRSGITAAFRRMRKH